MNEITMYLEVVKAKEGIKSDNQLALRLGVPQATVQKWMVAGMVPNDEACLKLAELAGDDPARIIALAHMVKASGAAKKAWQKIFKAVAAALSCLDCRYCGRCGISLSPKSCSWYAASFALILFLFISAPSRGFASDEGLWTSSDTVVELAYTTLHVMDWTQTLHGARNPREFEEENPILGVHPTKQRVNVYFGTALALHALVAYELPKPWRTIWQAFWIGVEADAVYHNTYSAGIRVHF